MKNGKKVASIKDKNNKDWEINGENNSFDIKTPTKRLLEKSGAGNNKNPPNNPNIMEM